MIAIIDYGIGNLRSVQKAFEFIGIEAIITCDVATIREAERVVLPGVGAFQDAINAIKDRGLYDIIMEQANSNKPFLGICVGMQLLFDMGYEDGEHKGLGIISGNVIKFELEGLKIPQIGWNEIIHDNTHPYLKDLPDNMVYFVHSYYCDANLDNVIATCEYGIEFPAVIAKDNIFAVQFHPEKSGDTGLEILRRFGGVK